MLATFLSTTCRETQKNTGTAVQKFPSCISRDTMTKNKKLSCGWHAAQMLVHVFYWPDFPTQIHSPEGSSWPHISRIFRHLTPSIREITSNSYLVWDKWNGWWRSHDNELSCLDTIHQRDRHADSHVATAALKHCIPTAKNYFYPSAVYN